MLNKASRKPGRNWVARETHKPTPSRFGSPRAYPKANPLPTRVNQMLKKRRTNLDVQSPLSASILQGPTFRHLARPIEEDITEVV